jgi:CCR4-NOT transcription complex subunit 3
LQSASNLPQKEKYEQELKRQIKKLQRERDSIKTWLGSNEIKDKTQLTETRKLIETQMERFKQVERELKTKAYSKEGLNAAVKLDPQEKEKQELYQWLGDIMEKLNTLVDKVETEHEVLTNAGKKGKKIDPSKQEKLNQLDAQIVRHKLHLSKLEVVLRMLENGNLTIEEV